MSPDRFTLADAVAAAVIMEEEGVRFYTLAMEKAADPEVQIMSRFLRDVEYEHIEYFRELLAPLSSHAPEEAPPFDPDTESYLRYLAEMGVFPAHGAAGRALRGIRDVCDMLRLGLRAEKDERPMSHMARSPSLQQTKTRATRRAKPYRLIRCDTPTHVSAC